MKVKICGITNLEDALHAARAGADALGFNFYERSPRYISPGDARLIIEKLPKEITKVGVFVNPTLDEIEMTAEMLDLIQLHGDESIDLVDDLRTATGVDVIKALRVTDDFDPESAKGYSVETFLLDTHSTNFGGSGDTFDWRVAVDFKSILPNFFLAGGLTPDNVAEAVRQVQPYGVDVCSGVETVKGKKDHRKVEAFIRNARAAL